MAAFALAEHFKSAHLFRGVLFADLAHRVTDMDQNPITWFRPVVFQKAQIHMPPYANDVDESGVHVIRRNLDDFPGYG